MRVVSAQFLKVVNACSRSVVVRLMLFAMAMIAIGLLLRIAILLPYMRERLSELSSAHQLAIAEYVAKDIDAKMRARLDFAGYLADHLPLALLADKRRLQDWLEEHLQESPLFPNGLIVVRGDGRGAIADYPVLAGRRDLDYTASDFFVQARETRRTVVGKPVRGRASGAPVIILAAPVRDRQGRVVAVLAGVTPIAAPGFLNLMQETRIGQSGGFLLVSPQDDLFVAATDTSKALTPLPRPGANVLHDRAMAGYRGTGITTNIHGVEELSAIASVPSTGWFLVARVPTDEALEALDSVKSFLVRSTAMVAIVVIGLGGLAVRQIFKPLTSAALAMHRMARGEMALQPLPVARRDEVGELVEGFNFLLARLDEATTQTLAEERLRLAEKERMEALLRQWMADTSHELRTPISVLRAQIEAIQDGVFTVDARRLDLLHGEVMGISRLVEDLFTLARSDVGQLERRSDAMAPVDLVDDVVSAFRERYAAAGLDIEWDEDGNACGPMVIGDSAQIRRVFSNLMENTLRYTDRGGRLRIRWSVAAGRLALAFDDTAPGVPDDALPHLFKRFYRVDISRSRASGGSGIGLALCHSLIEAHGGTITASHSPLGGLHVTILLPCCEEPA